MLQKSFLPDYIIPRHVKIMITLKTTLILKGLDSGISHILEPICRATQLAQRWTSIPN